LLYFDASSDLRLYSVSESAMSDKSTGGDPFARASKSPPVVSWFGITPRSSSSALGGATLPVATASKDVSISSASFEPPYFFGYARV